MEIGLHVALTHALRQLFVFAHLGMLAFAFVTVVLENVALIRGNVHMLRLRASGSRLLSLLAGMWLSGLCLLTLDAGGNLTVLTSMASKPGMSAKLSIAAILTVIAMVLQLISKPALLSVAFGGSPHLWIAQILGAISTASWTALVCIGSAGSIESPVTYSGLMLLYAFGVLIALCVARIFVAPKLSISLLNPPAP